MITRQDAVTFLRRQQRENEQAVQDARQKGRLDHDAETRAFKFSEIADMIEALSK